MLGPEAEIERQIVKEAKDEGWIVYKVNFFGTKGAPDRLFGKERRGVWIEFKRKGEVPNLQQSKRRQELTEEFGYEVHACDSLESARKILQLEA